MNRAFHLQIGNCLCNPQRSEPVPTEVREPEQITMRGDTEKFVDITLECPDCRCRSYLSVPWQRFIDGERRARYEAEQIRLRYAAEPRGFFRRLFGG